MMQTEQHLWKDGHLHEECGVFGVYSPETADLAGLVYYGLFSLQHRGQESAGMVINDDGVFSAYRDVGLVNDVFTPERLQSPLPADAWDVPVSLVVTGQAPGGAPAPTAQAGGEAPARLSKSAP